MNARRPARRVFLTGASSGIGNATARALAREGHSLALFARREPELRRLATELSAIAVPGDVTDRQSVERAVASAEAALGPLDTLVYAAGSARFHPVERTSVDEWREMMGANLDGLFHATQVLLPSLLRASPGHIVVLLSVASRTAFGGSCAYTAAKHGALGFVDSLRVELRPRVHVTAVLPGAVDTPLWDAIEGDWDRSRMMRAEQIADVIASVFRDTSSGMLEEIRIGPEGGSL